MVSLRVWASWWYIKLSWYWNMPKVYIRHEWNTLWIRKDEFHKSLDIDSQLLQYLSKDGVEKYVANLSVRRAIAHKRGLN